MLGKTEISGGLDPISPESAVTRLLTAMIVHAVREAEYEGKDAADLDAKAAALEFLQDPIAERIAVYLGVPGWSFQDKVREISKKGHL